MGELGLGLPGEKRINLADSGHRDRDRPGGDTGNPDDPERGVLHRGDGACDSSSVVAIAFFFSLCFLALFGGAIPQNPTTTTP